MVVVTMAMIELESEEEKEEKREGEKKWGGRGDKVIGESNRETQSSLHGVRN